VFPALAFSAIVTVILAFAVLLLVKQSVRGIADAFHQPVWLWLGGALSLLIILAITVAPPRLGIATTIGIIIALNLAVGAVIDRFGLFGYERIAFGWPRIVGLLLLGAGAALSLQKG
jgi:transporter family-2 protein